MGFQAWSLHLRQMEPRPEGPALAARLGGPIWLVFPLSVQMGRVGRRRNVEQMA